MDAIPTNVEQLRLQIAKAQEETRKAIAERDAARAKLKEHETLIQEAEKTSRMKSLFLANMSHEIRTPLNAIEGFARIMAETESAEGRMEFLEIIESNNNRLQSLINEILDLSRIEAGELTIKKSETNLHELCKNIKLSFKFRLNEEVELICEEPEEEVNLVADANRIMQVLSNLIGNAVKHTAKGSITFGYRIVNSNTQIEFFVCDTGNGIASADLGEIFNTYVSRDAETTKNGHGLGLPLCKILVERMGGFIDVQSQVGHGATFTFTLPFEGTVSATAKKKDILSFSSKTFRVTIHPQNKSSKCILVAEDEESNFQLVKNIFGKRYRLLHASNGIEAVTLFDEERPDLVLMDIRMPGMTGLDATRIIKEVSHGTPIIILSAYAFEENISEAKVAGCDKFITKPFKVEDIIETVSHYLDN